MTTAALLSRAELPITERELGTWVDRASPGDVLIYFKGFLALDRVAQGSRLSERDREELVRVADRALRAAYRGWAHAVQKRLGPDRYEYRLVARQARQASSPRRAEPVERSA